MLYFLIATTNANNNVYCTGSALTGQNTITCGIPDQNNVGSR